jgi:hypothetical protein
MFRFTPYGIVILLIQFACAAHAYRTGRSFLWILAIMFFPVVGVIAYILFAVLPDLFGSNGARRFADDIVNVADPGRGYREKKRNVEMVGSNKAKKELADECLKQGRFKDAVDLYDSALNGPLGGDDPSLLRGRARARLLAGDGAGAQADFDALRTTDPISFDADAALDYARALALQGKNDDAVRHYENLIRTYPGEEARARYALLLQKMGETDKAKALFKEILDSVRHAPGHYRRRQREWVSIARKNK